jgi:hypothetical protein
MTDAIESRRRTQRAARSGNIWILFVASLLPLGLAKFLGLFDTTTRLVPRHDQVDQACLILGLLLAIVAGATALYLTAGLTIIQRIMLPLVITFETAIGAFLLASQLATFAENTIDFPAAMTHTHQVLLPIALAYQTHGKGANQYIRTMPFGTDLTITSGDFTFLRTHRLPDGPSTNPDRILSQGYFCARVTIEQSDTALRVLRAGFQHLPAGSVVVCPTSPYRLQ